MNAVPESGPAPGGAALRTIAFTLSVLGLAAASVCAGRALLAADDDADKQKVAADALAKAIAHGKDLFNSKDLGKKSCAACHDAADKPNLNLATRAPVYPKYSDKAKAVVSMGQKINEMVVTKSSGKALDLAGADVTAIEAYIVSLRK
jgi:cytochrome c